jgi:hypothetical protein
MNRIAAHQFGDRRNAGRLRVEKDARATTLEESDSPAVAMDVGGTAARLKSGKGKADVGRDIAVHGQ